MSVKALIRPTSRIVALQGTPWNHRLRLPCRVERAAVRDAPGVAAKDGRPWITSPLGKNKEPMDYDQLLKEIDRRMKARDAFIVGLVQDVYCLAQVVAKLQETILIRLGDDPEEIHAVSQKISEDARKRYISEREYLDGLLRMSPLGETEKPDPVM